MTATVDEGEEDEDSNTDDSVVLSEDTKAVLETAEVLLTVELI